MIERGLSEVKAQLSVPSLDMDAPALAALVAELIGRVRTILADQHRRPAPDHMVRLVLRVQTVTDHGTPPW